MKMMMAWSPRRLFWPLVCTVTVLFCCGMLKMYYHQDSYQHSYHQPVSVTDRQTNSRALTLAATTANVSNDTFSLTTSADPPLNFTCFPDENAEGVHQHFPPLQEFLRNRHCRTFPALLTPSPCEDDLYLLLAIKSTAVQVERRAALRDTWGRAGLVQRRRIKIVFLMGRSLDEVQSNKLQPMLEWENRQHGDILQWDFVDIFFNLTRKEVHFLSWFSRSCGSAQFVFKGDDDVFVNTKNLVEYLSTYNPEDHLFTGYIHRNAYPDRNQGIKYYIPVEMYPEKPYPPFPSGGGYLMSRQTMLGLNAAAQKVKLFPLDDVFLGMCLHEMSIELTHHHGFLTFGFGEGQSHSDPCVYRDIMLVHRIDPQDLRVMWGLMHDDSLPCRTKL